MKRIALVQRYAYDSSANGDASYVQALGEALTERGHDLFLFTTNMMVGRTKPFYVSSYKSLNSVFIRWGFRIFKYRISSRPSSWISLLNKVLSPTRREVTISEDYELDSELTWLKHHIKNKKIDKLILIYDGAYLTTFFRELGVDCLAIPVFLCHNFSALHKQESETGARDMLIGEVEHLRNAPFVGFHSDDDIAQARRLGVNNPCKVGIGVAVKKSSSFRRVPKPNTMLFVAALAKQNVESLSWFLESVVPIIFSEMPDAQLRIVGNIGKALKGKDVDRRVSVLGFVQDIESEYCQATLVVAPLVIGSKGMKVKVAEALAYDCPIVATSISVDSSDLEWANHTMVLADTPRSFATAVIDILRSPVEQRRLSMAAAKAYDQHICYEAAYRQLNRFIDR